MDYCEINRQLEYLIIIVETVTSPQLSWTEPPGFHSLKLSVSSFMLARAMGYLSLSPARHY